MTVERVAVFQGDAAETAREIPVGPERHAALPADFPANARPAEDGSYILEFEYPVRMRMRDPGTGATSEAVTRQLQLHRLKGKHQKEIARAAPEDVATRMIACSARMDIGRAELLADEMDSVDIAAALRVIRFFMTPGRPTGR